MIARVYSYVSNIPAVFIDGVLYVAIAVFGAILAFLGSDEAFKYINPYVLFWAKGIDQICLAGVTALKMFRSTSYADHQKSKKDFDTQFLQKPVEPKP